MHPPQYHRLAILLLGLILAIHVPSTTALPVLADKSPVSISPRQDIKLPLGISITDLDLADISPIEDGWLELDSDDGDGNDLGSSSVSNANGYLGSVGSGQASQNGNSLEGSNAACSLTGCVTSAAASNGNSTSTSSASTGGLINGPLISGPLISGPIIENNNIENNSKKHMRRFWIV